MASLLDNVIAGILQDFWGSEKQLSVCVMDTLDRKVTTDLQALQLLEGMVRAKVATPQRHEVDLRPTWRECLSDSILYHSLLAHLRKDPRVKAADDRRVW